MRRRHDTVTGGMRGAAGPKDDIMSMEAHIRGEHEATGLANKDVMNLSQARWHPWTWAIHRAVRATRIVTDHEDEPLVAAGSVASLVDLVMGSCT